MLEGVKVMSREGKLLLLTWVLIGLAIAGAVGFYLGRTTTLKNLKIQQLGPQGGQPPGSPPPGGGQQQPPRQQPTGQPPQQK